MKQKEREKRRSRKRRRWIVLLVFIFLSYTSLTVLAAPVYAPVTQEVAIEHEPVEFSWPSTGTVSVGSSDGVESLASNNGDVPVPSASTIKLLTALVVLEQKPLGANEQGEAIYFGAQDVERFNETVAKGGVALAIPNNTTITYREALAAMLVGSANNIADKLAIWGFGSVDAYAQAAKLYARKLQLNNTKVTDASGLLPTTTTSANDMLKIGKAAVLSPAISNIVKKTNFTFENGTVLKSTNTLLGGDGIIGLKTGNTEEAGYCFAVAKKVRILGRDKVLYVSTFGQSSHEAADAVAISMLAQVQDGFQEVNIANKNQAIAYFEAPWGTKIEVKPRSNITATRWKGVSVSATVDMSPIKHARKGDVVGSLTIDGQTYELFLDGDLPSPSIWWRIENAVPSAVDFITEKR